MAEKLAAAKENAAKKSKLKTITCTQGKLKAKITGDKPVCPAGYKKK
jgi:hypothetical protein